VKRLVRVLAWVTVLHAGAALALPGPADLTRIAFPTWQDSGDKRVQMLTLPESADGWGTGSPIRVQVVPKAAIQTSAVSMTLIVGLVPTGDEDVSVSHVAITAQ
jgi:hypothetical protein